MWGTLDDRKNDLESKKGKHLKFRHNGSRNQIEEFEGIITDTYNYIFTIKKIGDSNETKSFSYSDVLISNLEIYN